MKRFLTLLSIFGILACSLPSLAVTMLIKNGATTPIEFLLVDSATGQIGQTGLSGSVVIKISKNAGTGAASAGTIAEIDSVNFPGIYSYTPTTTETNTTGILAEHITCAGCQTQDVSQQVVAFDPSSATNLGLSALPTASPAANGGLPTVNASNQVAGVSGNVVGSVASVASAVTLGANEDTALARLFGILTSTPAFTSGSFVNFPNVTVGGYATGQDAATLVWNKDLSSGFTGTSAGNIVNGINGNASTAATNATTAAASGSSNATTLARLQAALAPTVGIVSTSSTTTNITTNLTNITTNQYLNQIVVFTSGANAGVESIVTAYNGSTKALTISPALPVAPVSTDTFTLVPTSLGGSISGNVTVGGYASGQDPATLVLGATASSWNTALTIGNKVNSAGSSGDPWQALLTSENISGSYGALVKQMLFDGNSNIKSTPQTNVTVGGYASGQDPASLVLAATVDGTLTLKQIQALSVAVISGNFTVNRNVIAKTLTVVYNRQNGSPLATQITTYSDTGLTLATGRTTTFSNLP